MLRAFTQSSRGSGYGDGVTGFHGPLESQMTVGVQWNSAQASRELGYGDGVTGFHIGSSRESGNGKSAIGFHTVL